MGALLYCRLIWLYSQRFANRNGITSMGIWAEQGVFTQMSGKSGVSFSFDSVWELCFMYSCRLVKLVDKLMKASQGAAARFHRQHG